MNQEIIQGSIVLISILGGCSLSLYFFQKDKIGIAFLVVLFLGFLLRVYCSQDPFLHEWDERYHALVAKNMMENPLKPTLYKNPILEYDYREWRENHVWLHKQPVPLWTIAISLKMFGAHAFAVRIPSILLSTLCIWFTFLIGKKMFNVRVGYWAAFFLMINGLVIEITTGRVTTDHIDLFFLFFIELGILLSLLFYENRKTYFLFLIGVSTGLAVLCKWLPALIVLPFFFIVNFDTKKIIALLGQSSIILLSSILVFLPWQVYTSQSFPLEFWWEQSFNIRHFTEGLDGFGQPWWYFLDQARMVWNELIYLSFIGLVYFIFRRRTNQSFWAILIWIILPYGFFSMAATKMQGYVLFTAPAIFIMQAVFVEKLIELWKNRDGFLKWSSAALFIAIILLSIRFGMERIKPFSSFEKPVWVKRIEKLEKKFEQSQKTIIFNEPKYVEVMFKYDCIAYRRMP